MLKINSKLRAVFISILIMPFLAESVFPLTVQVKSGAFLTGEIISHDESGVDFKVWDTQGFIKLKWHHFDIEEANRLKGLLSLKSMILKNTYKIDGQRIYMKNGTINEGVAIETSESHVKIKMLIGVKSIPLNDILKSENIKIDPLKIYASREWYEERVKSFDLSRAVDNFELAEYCMVFFKLYDKARDHYNKAAELSASYQSLAYQRVSKIDAILLQSKTEEVEKLIANKDSKSLELAASIISTWRSGGITLTPEMEKEVAKLEQKIKDSEQSVSLKAQKELVRKICQQYHGAIKSLIKKISGQKLTYNDAFAYVNMMLYRQAVDKLSKDNKMSEDEVVKILSDKSPRKYDDLPKRESSFGEGTWIIAQDIRKKPASMTPEDFARYQKKVRAVAEAKDRAVQRNEFITPDVWWSKLNEVQKESFLESLFAERYMRIVEHREAPCGICSGEGISNKNLCKRCWGAMEDLIVVYQ